MSLTDARFVARRLYDLRMAWAGQQLDRESYDALRSLAACGAALTPGELFRACREVLAAARAERRALLSGGVP